MRYSFRTLSIAVALIVSIGLITAAFIVSGSVRQANAENAEQLLRAYATKDTDSDGLPDWQEKLYGTDPANAHSIDATMTDSAAVEAGLVKPRFESENIASTTVSIDSVPGIKAGPDTVTDKFSRLFFEQYLRMRASGVTPTTDELIVFINQSVDDLADANQIPRKYTAKDVSTSGSGVAALQTYAASAESALMGPAVGPGKDPMFYFSKVVYQNDAQALAHLKQQAREYTSIEKALIKVRPPQELAALHLRFSNGMALMSTILQDLTAVNDDPLRAFLVLGQYNYAAQELASTMLGMNSVYTAAGAAVSPEQQGYMFYSLLTHTAATDALLKNTDTP